MICIAWKIFFHLLTSCLKYLIFVAFTWQIIRVYKWIQYITFVGIFSIIFRSCWGKKENTTCEVSRNRNSIMDETSSVSHFSRKKKYQIHIAILHRLLFCCIASCIIYLQIHPCTTYAVSILFYSAVFPENFLLTWLRVLFLDHWIWPTDLVSFNLSFLWFNFRISCYYIKFFFEEYNENHN